MKLTLFIFFLTMFFSVKNLFAAEVIKDNSQYPKEWWAVVPKDQAASWEILPQEAKEGEVILSKRTELGIFSNLGLAPFKLDDEFYNSVEGLWQGMKYPDPTQKSDLRLLIKSWPHTRAEVYKMSGWDAKKAGDEANEVYKKNPELKLINYHDHFFAAKDGAEGSAFHLALITRATEAKINQNPKIKELLLKTRGLILKPDHKVNAGEPPSYEYYNILMKIRDGLK